jgi:PDZ domain-containing protein
VRTSAGPAGEALIGVELDPSYRFPFSIRIGIDNVGGPSAGTMFALGIIDTLTPGSLTGGQRIAGTGTISAAGGVGAIGGIRHKMVGARRAGARWFLAPAANCAEVVGHVPAGLRVVRVRTLSEALDAVQRIAAHRETGSLPACTR